MKKSSIVILTGCFVLVTVLLCISNEKMYEKHKYFYTINEVLEQMQSYPVQAKGKTEDMTETDEFKECLSKRKRLTPSQIDFKNIKILKVYNISEEEKEKMVDDYKALKQNLSLASEYNNIQVARVNAIINTSYSNDTEQNVFDFVFIDEGEGLVIDYIKKLGNKEIGDLNAEY